ncbi:MAG: hypothetical protein IT534_13535, partial [Bauldia sp.]|nr:hypothetical protein [Bauldia sp.]
MTDTTRKDGGLPATRRGAAQPMPDEPGTPGLPENPNTVSLPDLTDDTDGDLAPSDRPKLP